MELLFGKKRRNFGFNIDCLAEIFNLNGIRGSESKFYLVLYALPKGK